MSRTTKFFERIRGFGPTFVRNPLRRLSPLFTISLALLGILSIAPLGARFVIGGCGLGANRFFVD
jgi:hypothetical protein